MVAGITPTTLHRAPLWPASVISQSLLMGQQGTAWERPIIPCASLGFSGGMPDTDSNHEETMLLKWRRRGEAKHLHPMQRETWRPPRPVRREHGPDRGG